MEQTALSVAAPTQRRFADPCDGNPPRPLFERNA